jgi:hypothetical protein
VALWLADLPELRALARVATTPELTA